MPIHRINAVPPFVQVGLSVGIAFLVRKLGDGPRRENGLIDTGASMTAVAPFAIRRLRAQRVGRRLYARPGGIHVLKSTYAVRVSLQPAGDDIEWAAEAHWFDVIAVEAEIATPGISVLLGQDLLSQMAMSWDGPESRLTLMY